MLGADVAAVLVSGFPVASTAGFFAESGEAATPHKLVLGVSVTMAVSISLHCSGEKFSLSETFMNSCCTISVTSFTTG